MIPKIAWTHWAGPMSWIRTRGLETFRELNPSWDLRVIDTPPEIAARNLQSAQAGDWAVWRKLKEFGGMRIDSDIIHLNPIPEEWLNYDLCAQLTSNGNFYQMAALCVVPNSELMRAVDDLCATIASEISGLPWARTLYQAFGVAMLRTLGRNGLTGFGSVLRMSDEAFCFFHWRDGPHQLWSKTGPICGHPSDCGAVGVHWYGGSPVSMKREYGAHNGGPSWIERLASGS